MLPCLFVSDLHGNISRYQTLFQLILAEKPAAVFIGGDILPAGTVLESFSLIQHRDFINQFLIPEFKQLRQMLGNSYPEIFIIMGNDDPRFEEISLLSGAAQGLWHYLHNRHYQWYDYYIFGYAYIPPSPFRLKDWERYDVSRYADPGCISPEEGYYSFPVSNHEKKFATIEKDLENLCQGYNLSRAIFLFHSPPYNTLLDRAALDKKLIDRVPLDVHVGSIAIREFMADKQPYLTLHGHIHESSRLTGNWQDKIGHTTCFSAAYHTIELAVIRFDPEKLDEAQREIIAPVY